MAAPQEYEPAPWHQPRDPNREPVSQFYTVDGTQDFSQVGPDDEILSGHPGAMRRIAVRAGDHLSEDRLPLDLPPYDNGATTTLGGGQEIRIDGKPFERVDYTVGPEPKRPSPPEQH